MPLLNLHSVMADVLARHNELIPVLNRFGIRIGVGEKTVQEICLEHHLNPDLILTVLNVYLDDTYLPESSLTLFDAEPIADYFRHTVENYLHALVPNIEVHLNALIATAGTENKELGMLRMLFLKFKERMTNYLQKNAEYSDDFPDDLLHDLKNILIKHLSVEHNQNLSYAVIFSLHSFEKDLAAHNRLRNKVLKPKLNELDSYGIQQLQENISNEHDHQKEESDHQLTNRETEILRLIVKGYLNKEIADELNISHNTVLTHRKNIITKTGIKTVSGLTFYCIRKGLISM
ncbi:MAG: LuxR C-terminal-related transcriptional regulator [Porphyromonadaceae bacterium]|nr:LuxR C-terminal-related transcriptional regulator [Porphyromonadaceae bacterium]